MTFKTARESFEDAQQIAEQRGDEALALLAAGLVELARQLAALKRDISDIQQKVR